MLRSCRTKKEDRNVLVHISILSFCIFSILSTLHVLQCNRILYTLLILPKPVLQLKKHLLQNVLTGYLTNALSLIFHPVRSPLLPILPVWFPRPILSIHWKFPELLLTISENDPLPHLPGPVLPWLPQEFQFSLNK